MTGPRFSASFTLTYRFYSSDQSDPIPDCATEGCLRDAEGAVYADEFLIVGPLCGPCFEGRFGEDYPQ